MNFRTIFAGALTGFAAAAATDIHAYLKAPDVPDTPPKVFNYGLAAQRWGMGAVLGALLIVAPSAGAV